MALQSGGRRPVPRLPRPPKGYDEKDQTEFRRALEVAFSQSVATALVPYLSAEDYGVVGDGVTDDGVALQAALTAGYEQNKAVYCGALVCLVSKPANVTAGAFVVGTGYTVLTVGTTDFTAVGASTSTIGVHFIATGVGAGTGTATPCALTMQGPGIIFDQVSHGNEGGPGILVTGTAYTALLITRSPQYVQCSVYGTGNAANGVVFQNPLLARVQYIRVFDLDGFGVKINKCWDCVFESVSVEQCGNTTHYAFSVNDDAPLPIEETSNMSHFLRLQVEKPNTQAIYIAPNTLSCLIDNIHSEQATVNASYVTWELGGGSCQYNSARFHANGTTANGTVKLNASHTMYCNLRAEGDIVVTALAFVSGDLMLVNPTISGTFKLFLNQTGQVTMSGGIVNNFASDLIRGGGASNPGILFSANGTHFASVLIGDCQNPAVAELAQFINCSIDDLDSSSTQSAGKFTRCVIKEGNNLLSGTSWQGKAVYDNCDITCASAAAASSSAGTIWLMNRTILNGALTFTNNAPVRIFHSTITGTVSKGDAGAHDIICDAHAIVGASSSGFSEAPTGGAHARGETHYDPLPSTAAAPGWRCTTAATPGTFKAFANLA